MSLAELKRLRKDVAALRESMAPIVVGGIDPHGFAGRPVEYAEQVLGIKTLTEPQKAILRALHVPPYRVLVPSGHSVGKTFIAAVACSYWYDSFNPGLVLTTAPTERDVNDLLWTEIRLIRQHAAVALDLNDLAPRSAHMGDSPDHYAKGYVSRKNQGFQGRHRQRMLFVFDEANDVDGLHWTTVRTMADPTLNCAWLAIFNPTSTTSQAYQEDMQAKKQDGTVRWHRIGLNALEHPNIAVELAGDPKIIPGAVSLGMVNEWVDQWCEPLMAGDEPTGTDLLWPPNDTGKWYKPGPIFQARAQGTWPDVGNGVWSPAIWKACLRLPKDDLPRLYPLGELPEIGCDCATGHGDDFMAIHARWGMVSVHHETANTMDEVRIFARLKAVAKQMADLVNSRRHGNAAPVRPQDIAIKIDDDGTGGGIGAFLRADGYRCYQVGAPTRADDVEHYPNKRSELWFQVAAKAKKGIIHLGLLDRSTLDRLEQQLLAPAWELDRPGRMVVEPKDVTKEKISRSPDDADAFNLAYLSGMVIPAAHSLPTPSSRERLEPGGDGGRGRGFRRFV